VKVTDNETAAFILLLSLEYRLILWDHIWYMSSTNSQSVNPVKDLLDRIVELQRILEDLDPNIRNKRVRSRYENVRTRLADAKSAILSFGSVLDRYGAS
jgi:hypothetical protein